MRHTAIIILCLLALSALAEAQDLKVYKVDGMAPGSWATYSTASTDARGKTTIKKESVKWLERTGDGDCALEFSREGTVAKVVATPEGAVKRVTVTDAKGRTETRPPQGSSASLAYDLAAGAEDKGIEEVTTKAGTYSCRHYIIRTVDQQQTAKDKLTQVTKTERIQELWVSQQVDFPCLVKEAVTVTVTDEVYLGQQPLPKAGSMRRSQTVKTLEARGQK